ncbi:hypothetical protein GEV33_003958 [Tenebrio molitor]|uniref:Uncharacterized protein n=1 Tax=Tenebrio molitor TaxID=7067 RepID=A0A8J6HRA6_TENMO|nr:hypothetical protein GEV33_003958 [Tenebrio molitor]
MEVIGVKNMKLFTGMKSHEPLKGPSTVAKRLARHFTLERSRVLTPVPPDQVWVFFRGFLTPSHRGISHMTDKANDGSVSTSQYLPPSFRTHPESSRFNSIMCTPTPPLYLGCWISLHGDVFERMIE